MTADTRPDQAARITGAVDDALRQIGVRRVILVVDASCPVDAIATLRRDERVVGLLVSAAPATAQQTGGSPAAPTVDSPPWDLAGIAADVPLVVGGINSIRPGELMAFAKSGYWSIWFVDPARIASTRKRTWPVVAFRKALTGFYNRSETVRSALGWIRDRIVLPAYAVAWNLFVLRSLRRIPSVPRESSNEILLVIGSLGAGGSERQIVNTAIGLKQRYGLEPTVACLNLRSESASFYRHALEAAAIECIDLSEIADEPSSGAIRRTRSMSRVGFLLHPIDAGQFGALLSVLEGRRPAVVHSFLDHANIKAGIAALVSGVPRIVLSTRSVAPDNFWRNVGHLRFGYRRLLQHRSIIMCNNSQAGADDYRRWLALPQLAVSVVRNGIDLSDFEPQPERRAALRAAAGIPGNALLVGGVMRFTEEKRPELWARAAVEMSRRRADIHFVLAGDGPMLDEIKQIFERARITARVHLLGRVRDVASVYRMLDLFLLTSRKEGLPNALIEAQAVGVPVVTTPAGGAVEALDPSLTGRVIDADDPILVARACLDILTDKSLHASMSSAAPDWVRERFAPERMLQSVVADYGPALKNRAAD